MADEKELELKGIDTSDPDGGGEPDKNPIKESAKDDIKSSDAFILPETQRDISLSGLTQATLSSAKSPAIRKTDLSFDKEQSDALDKAYTPFDLAKAIPDPNERAEYIRQHGSNMVDLLDPNIQGITFADELKDLYNFRKNNYNVQLKQFVDKLDADQGFFDALGNTTQKLLGKTAVAVSSIVPLVVGIGSAVINWDANKIFNNTLFDEWDKMDKWTDEHYVVYGGYDYTQPGEDGKQKNFFARMADNPMKSINNDIIPAAAFIAGAVLTETLAGALAAPTGGASLIANTSRLAAYGTRAFSKGVRLARGLDAVSDIQNMRKIVSLTNKFKTGLGTATTMVRTAGYESSLIARDTYQSTKDKSIRNYINSPIGVKRGLKEKYENLILNNMDEFGNMSITETEVLEELSKDIPKADKIRIQNNAENAGELAWFSNVPLVGFSNMMQFPRIFNSSYRLGQGMIRMGQKLNPLTGTKIVAGKMVARGAERNLATRVLGKTVMPTVARGIGEGFEEFTQGVFEEGYSDYYSAEFSDPSKEILNSFLPTMSHAAKAYFKSVEGQDSIAIGAIMGMFGMPGVRMRSSQEMAEGKRKFGFTWYGGAYEGYQEVAAKMKEAENQANIYNAISTNTALQTSLQNMLKGASIQDDMDKALAKGDIFNYKNKEHEYFYNFVSSRIDAGIADTILQDLDALEEMGITEFNENYAIQDKDFQYTESQKEKIIETARDNTKSIIKNVEESQNYLDDQRHFVDKVFNKKYLGASSYSTPVRSALNIDEGMASGQGNIDNRLEEFVEKQFEEASAEEKFVLKERMKLQLRNQLAFLMSSADNIEKREKELTESLRGLVGENGLSAFLNDNNFVRFVVGAELTTLTLEDGTEVQSNDPKFSNNKEKLEFAVSQILADIKQKNPVEYNFAEKQIKEIVTDLFKLKDKKQKASAFYNMLTTVKGAQEFTSYLEGQREVMTEQAMQEAIRLQEEQLNSAKSSTTSANVSQNANDLNNQKRQQASLKLRQSISDKQTKELAEIIDILDQLLDSLELKDYTELDSRDVIKILERYPNAFQIIKDRLGNAIPGLKDIDSIPGLKHLETENFFEGASIEQIVSETLFSIIDDYQFKSPGPNSNLNEGNETNKNSFGPGTGEVRSGSDALDLVEDVENKGGATDNFIVSVTNDKEFPIDEETGKTIPGARANRTNGDSGKFKDKKTDQPINKKDVNNPNTLTLEEIKDKNPKVKLRFSDNEYGNENNNAGIRAIDIIYVDSNGNEVFYGRLPATHQEVIREGKTFVERKEGVSPKLIALRNTISDAKVNDKGFLEIETTTASTYKGYEATVTPKTETKETLEEWENRVPFKIAKQKATPDSEIENDFDPFDINTTISEEQFNKRAESGQPIKLIDSNKNEFIPETYEEYTKYIEFEKKMLSAKIEQAIKAKDEQKGIENLVVNLSKNYGYDMIDVAQIKRFVKARREGKTNASTAEWLLGPLAKTETKETTSPETEVEQSARGKIIEQNFKSIIAALTANPIIEKDDFIGKEKCN